MKNFNVEFAKRMEIVAKRLGSVSELCRRVDVAYPTATKWVKEGAEPSTTNLIKIADAAGVNLLWLATGQGFMLKEDGEGGGQQSAAGGYNARRAGQSAQPAPEVRDTLGNPVDLGEFVFVPRYNVRASAGNGFPVDTEEPLFPMAFRRFWIENYLNAAPEELSVIKVRGDSMEPVLYNNDNILVNHAKRQPGNGLFVVRIGGELVVKYTQIMPGDRLLLKSANPIYDPFEVELAGHTSGVEIIGRVEWFGRQI